jgi:hypothetical protein
MDIVSKHDGLWRPSIEVLLVTHINGSKSKEVKGHYSRSHLGTIVVTE